MLNAQENEEQTPPEPYCSLKKFFDKIGAIATFGAMAPQGIFGALLADLYMQDEQWSNAARIVGMSLVGITAEEGKRQLLRFFNEDNFKNIDTFIKNLHPKYWSVTNGINAFFTLCVMAVFVYLTRISLNQGADLLYNYNTKGTDAFGDALSSLPLQLFFMICSGITNLLGFPSIFSYNFVPLVEKGFNALVETPAFRKERDKLSRHLKFVRRDFERSIADNDHGNAYDHLLTRLGRDRNGYHTLEELEAKIAEFETPEDLRNQLFEAAKEMSRGVMQSQFLITRESWLSKIIKHLIGLVLSIIAMIGMYNFRAFGEQLCQPTGWDDSLDSSSSYLENPGIFPYFCGLSVYTAMNIMMFGIIYSMVLEVAGVLNGQEPFLRMQTIFQIVGVALWATFVSGLGGTPNAYQAHLADEDPRMMTVAAVGSLEAEFIGVAKLTSSYSLFNQKNKGVNARLVKIDEKLQEAEMLDGLGDEEITDMSMELIDENEDQPTLPPQRYRPSYEWVKERASCCFFSNTAAATAGLINEDAFNYDTDKHHTESFTRQKQSRSCCVIL